ncbi:uncharacterized protein LOC133711661 [Rosa rugosa]|uniref:uncharacterized protein LOC133711661 n=1 Tax=Rosa rugosa TaxID=74645 RepID=UPI002B40750F|nr:uncharacterized protein LOC133711661 [Rosa rugosa]
MVHFNQALLAKQGWRILQSPDSLIAKLYKARYFPRCDFLDAEVTKGASYAWRSIMHGKNLLRRGVRYRVGTGAHISAWRDPWVPLPIHFKPFSSPALGYEELRVCDLMVENDYEWNIPLLEALFTPMEVGIIASIPLSLRGADDSFVWHYDKRGNYGVRSGYHVARLDDGRSDRASSSNGSYGINATYWKIIWGANIPPKVRVFIWRLLRGILPTRRALSHKVSLLDSNCLFCNHALEDGLHLFRDCDVTTCFWVCTKLGLLAKNVAASCVEDWVLNVIEKLDGNQRCAFFMALWVIWSERNNVLWNESFFCASNAAQWASKFLEEYQQFHVHGNAKGRREKTKWQNPPSGRLKVNVDGSYRADYGDGGVGVVIRDENGMCLAALARYFPHASSSLHMEAEACRAGLLLAIHQDMTVIDVESDCSLVVTALQRDVEDRSEIGRIIDDCKSYLTSFHSIQVSHIFREANGVANR